jgi:glycosyltransferase involved in cell wall biosynthesis
MSAAPRHVLMTTDAVGGVWTYALDLAAALAVRGTRTTLAVLGPGLDASRRAQARAIPGLALAETGLPLDWLAESPAEVAEAGRALAVLAARHGVESVHLNSPALAAEARFGVPVVGTCHSCLATWWATVKGGALPADFAWRTEMLARGYAACDALVAPSAAFAAATQRAYRLPAPPEVVRNGRAPGPVATEEQAAVFTAGRLWDEGKDLATFDRVAAMVDLPVMAAGPLRGPNGAGIALMHCETPGPLDPAGIAEALARGPIFVSTARYEPFGLAVLEAAQAGCALVLSDIPAFREVWSGAALLVAPGDAAGFAGAIGWLSRNQEQRSRLRVAARERGEVLTAAAMADGVAAIHARLLGAGGAQRGRNAA